MRGTDYECPKAGGDRLAYSNGILVLAFFAVAVLPSIEQPIRVPNSTVTLSILSGIISVLRNDIRL